MQPAVLQRYKLEDSTGLERFQSSGLTSMEWVVIIAVTTVFCILLAPTTSLLQKSMRQIKAKTQMNQIRMAVRSYQTEYNVFPVPAGTYGDFAFRDMNLWNDLMMAFNGNRSPVDPNGEPLSDLRIANIRNVRFIAIDKKDVIPNTAVFHDPTFPKTKPTTYVMKLASGGNDMLTIEELGNEKVHDSVAIFSKNGFSKINKAKAIRMW